MESLNVVDYMSLRQLGRARYSADTVPDFVRRRVDEAYDNMHGLVINLRTAIDRADWIEISSVIGNMLTKLLDVPRSGGRGASDEVTSNDRETFIALGGMHLLRRFLEPPLSPADARSIPKSNIKARTELWNEVLVLLREICFSTPQLADQLFGRNHLTFLFTLLSHQSVFDNAVHLIEEILAVRDETFCMGEVPGLYSLLSNLSTRQLAHFCRVLALILFEPEDRQIMESAKVVKSFELLQLRRDRLTRAHVNAVELNQNLLIGAPNFLKRLVELLRILNFGPTVSEYVRHNIAGTSPLSADVLGYLSGRSGAEEWPHFEKLYQIASSGLAPSGSAAGGAVAGLSSRSADDWDLLGSANGAASHGAIVDNSDEEVMNQLLEAFSTNNQEDAPNRHPLDGLMNVLQVASRIGITPTANHANEYDGLVHLLTQMAAGRGPQGRGPAGRGSRQGRVGSDYSGYTSSDARHELQFQAMILAPHQVEILFVFCTLLSGRRKVQVQNEFATAGLPRVLSDMCTRMSWDSPPYDGVNRMEHIHGPDCECNPESALRVQFLRLVHNYYDRDFINNPLKLDFFSYGDVRLLDNLVASKAWAGPESLQDLPLKAVFSHSISDSTIDKTGLIGTVIKVLLREPHNSTYQFWLSSVIECFLRGSAPRSQMFVARSGLLKHLISDISSRNFCRGAETSLQSNFDLLGELIKYNGAVLVMMETMLLSLDGDLDFSTLPGPEETIILYHDTENTASEESKDRSKDNYSFDSFFKVVMDNIVDSNVFLRSTFMTLERISSGALRGEHMFPINTEDSIAVLINKYDAAKKNSSFGLKNPLQPAAGTSYLGTSWVQMSTSVASKEEQLWASRSMNSHKRDALDSSTASSTRSASSVASSRQRSSSSRSDDNSNSNRSSNSSCESNGESRLASSSLLASLGNGIRGAFSSMKETASSLLSSPVRRSKTNHGSALSDDEVKESGFDNVQDSYSMSSGAAASSEDNGDGGWTPISTTDNLNSEPRACAVSPNHWVVPKRIARLARFLLDNKIEVMFNLLSRVSLRSINHENICCLNSAITILIFENRRGSVGAILKKLRDLCAYKSYCTCRKNPLIDKKKGKSKVPSSPGAVSSSDASASALAPISPSHSVSSQAEAVSPPPSSPTKPASGEAAQASVYAQTRDGCIFCKPYQRSKVSLDGTKASHETQDPELFLNFRELLWYWDEYYLRRGRDRLSLEFSSRILYVEWKYVVELLSRDDGSPTSLLSRPIPLPLSPYRMISPGARFVLAGDRFEDYLVDPEVVAVDRADHGHSEAISTDATPARSGVETPGDTASPPRSQDVLINSDDIFTA